MRAFDVMCLTPVKPLTAAQIRKIRVREKASQAVFARYLNVTDRADQPMGARREASARRFAEALDFGCQERPAIRRLTILRTPRTRRGSCRPAHKVENSRWDTGGTGNALQLHAGAGGVPRHLAARARGALADQGGAAADGDRGGLRARRLEAAQPGDGPHRRQHPRGLRRRGLRLRRAAASCSRKWAATAFARRSSRPRCWQATRSSTPGRKPTRRRCCRASRRET